MARPRTRHAFRHVECAGIVGLGKACEVAQQEMAQSPQDSSLCANRLRKGLEAKLDEIFINGSMNTGFRTT